jgi:DNA-directed RNA polymerase subunit RPC12/RpoP
MEDAELQMEYLDVEGEAQGIRCPSCGAKYILEEFATTRMAKAEKMIEDK